jgi:nucleoside-triphosphatase THEP1
MSLNVGDEVGPLENKRGNFGKIVKFLLEERE